MSYKRFIMDFNKMPYKLFVKKLSGTTDPNEDLDFERLVQGDERTLAEFSFLQEIWEEAGHCSSFDDIRVNEDWHLVHARLENKFELNYQRIHWSRYFLRIAAVLLLTGGLSVVLYKYLIAPEKASIGFTTLAASMHTSDYVLPDGSTITLNKGAKVTFRDGFGVSSRDVILEGGAFFNVVPGSDLPFKVFSNQSVVEVTGTRFSVYEKNGNIHVAVESGTVVLSTLKSSSHKVNVTANQVGLVLNDDELRVENGFPINDISWKTGRLTFQQTPIDSALLDIAYHFNRDLIIKDNLEEKITAEFKDQPLFEILDEIKLVAGLAFDTTGNALIVRKQ